MQEAEKSTAGTTKSDSHGRVIYLETYGCQMNVYDTELVRSILNKAGYGFTQDLTDADVVMLNTCAIRENAHRKVYGRIHEIRHQRDGQPVKVGILGCMATNLRTELLDNPQLKIDFIAGPDSYKRLPALIQESFSDGSRKSFDVTLSEFETYSDVMPLREVGPNAWIAIMRGCNNFCTFCVVPYTRGRERSRTVENVVAEAEKLAQQGFKQVTLLGQNVNSYRSPEGESFAELMEAVSRVDGIERIRFTSPHPKDFPDDVIDVIANNPKVCKQIHMPLQAGNNRILELMNRTYTQEEFLAIVDRIRDRIPHVALSTDIIVGFSSETDEEFEDTYRVMEKVAFDSAFIFKYSERKNTIAARKHPDDVPEAIKTERIVRLNALQKEQSLNKNQAHIGQLMPILIEKDHTSKSQDHIQGRADNNKIVITSKGPQQIGDIINVRITDASAHVLKAEIAL